MSARPSRLFFNRGWSVNDYAWKLVLLIMLASVKVEDVILSDNTIYIFEAVAITSD